VYNFKKMAPVPSAEDFIDIVLTRTQRRTPTVVHPGYKISRIRQFYMRKVKFTQQTLSERLGQIIADFPRLDDIHPFYADLLNVLYDRDHYKLALGQVNMAKKLVEALGRDYVRLLKYGDTLYRCKQLKRAALGRMMTLLRRQKASFAYLDEVRRHMARLPALDPNTRTLLLTGFPNVGKSSFMNKVTRANVDVQPYAFTTKSLYVGHMDHRYLRWQVVDTPGLLDHSLSERNTIEMQAITALAHLPCCVLYFLDPSGQCGYTVEQQLSLFHSIKPLFANKQLLVVCNKSDVLPLDQVPEEERKAIEALADGENVQLMSMSNLSEQGVSDVKSAACDKLLAARVSTRMAGGKVSSVMNRLTVTTPAPRDGRVREASIPASVLEARAAKAAGMPPSSSSAGSEKKPTEKELMWENGGPGVYSCDYRKYYDLKNDEWRFDSIPEIIDGQNVADWVDPDIDAKLEALEREEEQLAAEAAAEKAAMSDESDVGEEERELAMAIRERRALSKLESRAKVTATSRKGRSRSAKEVRDHLEGLGVEADGIIAHGAKRGRSRSRAAPADDDGEGAEDMDVDNRGGSRGHNKKQKRSASTSRSVQPAAKGMKDEKQALKARGKMKKAQVEMNRMARAGESDRHTGPKLIKHLIAGKMGLGKRRSR
jgi:nucleolar GTP-binding protein